MKYYTSTTQFNCGIHLHAHQMYVCVMDRQGKKRVHTNIGCRNDLASIRHFDHQIFQLEEQLQRQTRQIAGRAHALLQTLPGIGEHLGLTILYEISDITRFPTVKGLHRHQAGPGRLFRAQEPNRV